MKKIIENIDVLSSFLSSEELTFEIVAAEKYGEKPPIGLDYGCPDEEVE